MARENGLPRTPEAYRAALLRLAELITLGCVLLAIAAGAAVFHGRPPEHLLPLAAAVAAAAGAAVALGAAARVPRRRAPLVLGLLAVHLGALTTAAALAGGLHEPFWVLFLPIVLVVGAASGTAGALGCGAAAAAGVYTSAALSHSLVGSAGSLLVLLPLFPVVGAVASAYGTSARSAAREAGAHRRAIETDVAALIAATTAMGGGDLRALPATSRGAPPETARLAVAFADTVVALRRCVRGMGGATTALHGKAAGIVATAEEQAQAGARQEHALRTTTRTVTELAGAAAAIAETAARVTACARRSMEHVQEGEAAVAAATDAMREIAERVADITGRAESLAQHGERIAEILAGIDVLAVRTDRLALGAAIEAARVADDGVGFRTVAGEIRRLAERSRQATAAAREVLLGVSGELSATVAEGRTGAADVAAGAARAELVSGALRLVATEAAGAVAAADEISLATEEQRAAADEVARTSTCPRPRRCRRWPTNCPGASSGSRWREMGGWADDPELVATFHAEVEERLTSLGQGLLELETHQAPRQLVAGLFRDAHTVKGSARMLGATDVLRVAHAAEDLLGALRDGRLPVRRDLVDLLLTARDAMSRAMPGAPAPLPADDLDALVAALGRVRSGEEVGPVPQLAAVPEPRGEDGGTAREEPARGRAEETVRVRAGKVYELLDAVGESELDVRRVARAAGEIGGLAGRCARLLRALPDGEPVPADALRELRGLVDQLTGDTRGLRELTEEAGGRLARVRDGSMALAMVPLRTVFAGLPRLVREVAAASGRDVRLELEGESVELDKQVLDGVADALRHLVTNAVDHGCEPCGVRAAAGKPAHATVQVSAHSAGGTVRIEVSDDGAGVDEARVRAAAVRAGLLPEGSELTGPPLYEMLFVPGFSTAERVTDVSGRGVGLDVVRLAVESLGGSVQMRSTPGAGTTFTLTLPVTLGVLRCLVARVGGERYALPVSGVVESIGLRDEPVHTLGGAAVVLRHGEPVPLLDLAGALGAGAPGARAAAVVVAGRATFAWAVDRLEGELELVVKDLGPFLGRLPLVTGATIDGDGSVLCVLDLRELSERGRPLAEAPAAAQGVSTGGLAGRGRVLVVEDSVGVRELERAILESAGYEVLTASDGTEGVSLLRGDPVDLVLSDVEMPGVDGFALTRTIRRTPRWERVPVIIMTSRGEESDQRAGMDAGADAYLLKSQFDQGELLSTVRRLVGR